MKVALVKFWGSVFWLGIVIVGSLQGGCSCDSSGAMDGGTRKEVIPERGGKFEAEIHFVTPKNREIVSGQIDLEVEVRDDDGIKEVAFWVNGLSLARTSRPLNGFPADRPHYRVQVETLFFPRGPITLKAEVTDLFGNKGSAVVQVITRERWAASFGVGHVRQFLVREDRHLYVRFYRSEEDMNNIVKRGPFDKVGSTIFTTNAVGTASWLFMGEGQDFGPFAMDAQHRLFFVSLHSDSGKSRLIALGPGEAGWSPHRKVIPLWTYSLGHWRSQEAPLLLRSGLWLHLRSLASAGKQSYSILAKYDANTGKERWRYCGEKEEKIDILASPYLLQDARSLLFVRPHSFKNGFEIRMLSKDGKLLWRKKFPQLLLHEILRDARDQHFYISVERQEKAKRVATSILCLKPLDGSFCWKNETALSLASKMILGNKLLIASFLNPDGSEFIAGLQISNGKKLWQIPLPLHRVVGLQKAVDDSFFLFAEEIDEEFTPIRMRIERFDAHGRSLWKYLNDQYFPKRWVFSEKEQERLWVIVRNNQDKLERFGSRILALDRQGKRLFLFGQENRQFQQLVFLPSNALYVSSYLRENARVHQLIAKKNTP